ncbi:MAG TPA: VOC family protein [Candidatus Baltobacteraceae bacterium]|nr:VOC family protein [Candidatus Baltobacteraceae bacterium]
MATIDRLTNVLVYQDISAAHDFLVEAFGFTPGGVERDGEGNAVHAEVRAGDTAIWLHRVAPEHQMRSPKELPAVSGGLYVYVDDVDAHFERARTAGAQTDPEPRTQPYGMYEYGARDTEGHHWWFGSPVST